jgi:hypothetical protein
MFFMFMFFFWEYNILSNINRQDSLKILFYSVWVLHGYWYFLYYSYSFSASDVWPQGFVIAKQVLYCLSHTSTPLYYSEIESRGIMFFNITNWGKQKSYGWQFVVMYLIGHFLWHSHKLTKITWST